MGTKTKALWAALLVLVALGVVGVGVAQGGNLTGKSYPLVITETDTETAIGKTVQWSIGGGVRKVECSESLGTSSTLSGPATKGTVTSEYKSCFSNEDKNIPVKVTMNKCDYVLEATSKTTGQVSIACANKGEQIEAHVYANKEDEKNNKVLCTYDMPEQGPMTGIEVTHTNTGTETEDLLLHLNISAKQIGNTEGSKMVCGITERHRPQRLGRPP